MSIDFRPRRSWPVLLLTAVVVACVVAAAPRDILAQGGASHDAISLQPGDLLKIDVWREPDLSGEFLVDQDGRVVLPLLGERQVTNVPIRQLRPMLVEEYAVQLRNPSINIVPLRRIYVLGEVTRPGLYEVDPTVTLAAAVAIAGGATPSGDLGRIRIVRDGEVLNERAGATSVISTVDVRSGDQILVDRRSWVERNSTFLISVGLSIPSVVAGVIALTRR